jgi:hypothetical protein
MARLFKECVGYYHGIEKELVSVIERERFQTG